MSTLPDICSRLVAFGRSSSDAELLASTCGNASLRWGDRMVITGSGAPLAALAEEQLAVIDLATGEHVQGAKPSMEAELHRRVYLARDKAGAVLHCQSRAATLLACATDPPTNFDLVPEVPAYVRRVGWVPFELPGSEALSKAVVAALADPDVTVVQLRNHGQLIVGATPARVIRRGTFFELACWMLTQGLPLARIPDEAAGALRDYDRRE